MESGGRSTNEEMAQVRGPGVNENENPTNPGSRNDGVHPFDDDLSPQRRYLQGMGVNRDPHRYAFTLGCLKCTFYCNTLQDMKAHLHTCTPDKGYRCGFHCGHCEKRWDSWADFCTHLLCKGMRVQKAKSPRYHVEAGRRVLFVEEAPGVPEMPSTVYMRDTSSSEAAGCPPVLHSITSPDLITAAARVTGVLSRLEAATPPDVGPGPSARRRVGARRLKPEAALGRPPDNPPDAATFRRDERDSLPDLGGSPSGTTSDDETNVPVLSMSPWSGIISVADKETPVINDRMDTPPVSCSETQGMTDNPVDSRMNVYMTTKTVDVDNTLANVALPHPARIFDPVATETTRSEIASQTDSGSTEVACLRRRVNILKRRHVSCLRQLSFWARTVADLGGEVTRPPSQFERDEREKLLSEGDWDVNFRDAAPDMSYVDLGSRFAAVYADQLEAATERFSD